MAEPERIAGSKRDCWPGLGNDGPRLLDFPGTMPVPDIFISYASDDRERVRGLVEALERMGWSVFWDQMIPPGVNWRSYLQRALEGARCVVVTWSAASTKSKRVFEEARQGEEKDILIPVFLQRVKLPYGFSELQATSLSGWDGKTDAEQFQRLVGGIQRILGAPPEPGKQPVAPVPTRRAEEVQGEAAANVEKEEQGDEPVRDEKKKEKASEPGGSSLFWGVIVAGAIAVAVYLTLSSWLADRAEPGPWASLTAQPASIEQGGSARLTWETIDAIEVLLEPGLGQVEAKGSQAVSPEESTTYTLEAKGSGGTTSKKARVFVAETPVQARIVELIVDSYHQKGFACPRLYLAPFIPEKALLGAAKAHQLAPDDILLVLDDTAFFHTAKNGFVLTAKAILWKEDYEHPQRRMFPGIEQVATKGGKEVLIDGAPLKIDYAESAEAVRDFVAILLRRLVLASQDSGSGPVEE